MVRVENIRSIRPGENGINHAVMDLQVSTFAESPDLGDVVEGMIVDGGSIEQVIQTGAFYTLDVNGTWYAVGGGD